MTTKPEPADGPTTHTEPVVAPTSAKDEIKAMGRIAAILDTACSDRIAVWVFERYRQPEEA